MASVDPVADTVADVLRGVSLVRLAVLFGSEALRTAHGGSDVDVAVRFSGVPSLGDELALQAVIERALGRSVDLVDLDRSTLRLRFQIARDGRLLVGPEHEWVRYRVQTGIEHADMQPTVDWALEQSRQRSMKEAL